MARRRQQCSDDENEDGLFHGLTSVALDSVPRPLDSRAYRFFTAFRFLAFGVAFRHLRWDKPYSRDAYFRPNWRGVATAAIPWDKHLFFEAAVRGNPL